jgi:hypothetical protein
MTVLSLTTNMNYKLPQSTITETHLSLSRSLSSLYGLRDTFLYLSLPSLSLSLITIFIPESSKFFCHLVKRRKRPKRLWTKFLSS